MMKKPLLLIILDGWGHREESADNAIAGADTPVWDHLWHDYPHTLINTSGSAVGLPDGQMGNSEVGHMNLGAGRIVYQEFTRISHAIETGKINDNPVLTTAIDEAITSDGAVHVMGLLSPGGVHSHEDHIKTLLTMAVTHGAQRVYLHAFLDGRDTPPQSAGDSLTALDTHFEQLGTGRIASLIGRYYAMDRDKRWDRVRLAYQLLTDGKAEFQADNAEQGLNAAYERGETDEFVKATVIGEQTITINDNDCVIFANFRADRARELSQAFTDGEFDGFERNRIPQLSSFVCLTEYQQDIKAKAKVAFPPQTLENSLGAVLAERGMTQLRIAETEKYAHVTFFFNGGREEPFAGEDRTLIPSPKVATYDLQPAMSAAELTNALIEALQSQRYDVIICNYANPDMVGHTGDYAAAVQAAETIDHCLGRIYDVIRTIDGELLITADHGNLEMMRDTTSGQAHTAHTTNPVPLIYIGRAAELRTDGAGALCDIAPSMLQLLAIPQPEQMTGQSLIDLVDSQI